MYWFAGKVDLCNELERTENDSDRLMYIANVRNISRDNLADLALRAVLAGDIEQGDGYGH
jgi:hypothetical protein